MLNIIKFRFESRRVDLHLRICVGVFLAWVGDNAFVENAGKKWEKGL